MDASQTLAGRRILITGASSGVGLEAARLFAAEGARLALLARSEEALREVIDEHGLDALPLAVDLTDRAGVEDAVARAVDELGGLDVVVSNAASAVFGHLLEVHPEDFERTIDVTFGGAVNLVRAALPHLRASRGTIVATGSLMSSVPLPTWSSYAAAKHALRGFLNSVSVEEREQRTGVRVALVHPGQIDTPLFGQSSSATGRRPRVPPDAYHAATIARALVAVAADPRPEVTLGGQGRLLEVAFGTVRPVAEWVIVLVDRWFRSGEEQAQVPGSLWEAPVRARASGGIPARDSLFAPLQLGRRLLPAPATPLRLARHIGTGLLRASQLRSVLAGPVAEVAPPERSLRERGERPQQRGAATV